MSTLDRSQKTIDRFKYEAETTAQLTHPNTVRILDFGSDGDVFYLVMEYLSGTDLTRFLRPDGQSDAFVSHVLFQTVCSLAEAHSRGVVHRDIKPSNLLLTDNCGVKICDFGLARTMPKDLAEPDTAMDTKQDPTPTPDFQRLNRFQRTEMAELLDMTRAGREKMTR